MRLSSSELERYERQMLISGWGVEAQRKVKAAKVAVVGTGGLGCLASLYLAAAGIGKMILVEGNIQAKQSKSTDSLLAKGYWKIQGGSSQREAWGVEFSN